MNGIERLIDVMKKTPPLKYLSALSQNRITPSQKESIEKLQTELKDEVINTIIDYVLRKNGFRFSPGYAEKIAATLLARRTETAEEALRFFSSLNRRRERREEAPVREVSHREVLEVCYEMLGFADYPKLSPLRKLDLSSDELDYLDSIAEHPWTCSEEENRRWDEIIEGAESRTRERLMEEEPSRRERFLSAWEKGNIQYAEPRN